MIFTHWGLNERLWYKVPLGPLSLDASRILVELPHANFIDPGYVLQRSPTREMIQLLHVDVTGHIPPFPVDIARGVNGTMVEKHPAAGWLVVVIPSPDFRTAEEKRLEWEWESAHADCPTCGAPGQSIGERCHYCVHVVPGA